MNPVVRRSSARQAPSEAFDEAKLRRSLAEACYSVGVSEGATDDFVSHVITALKKWLDNKTEVTDNDIRRKASETLETLCPEAGYLYKNQKSIL